MKKFIAFLLAALMLVSMMACAAKTETPAPEQTKEETQAPETAATETEEETKTEETAATTEKKGYVIGFTNSFNGNTFRQQEEVYFKELAEQMKADGIISEYYMACSNNDNAVQVSQIQNFIMMGVDAIIVDPGSATALNGAIDEAVDAGIPVLVFNDGPVTTSSCYQLNVDCVYNFGYLAEWACKKLDYKGDVLIIRGLPGNSYDELAYKGMIDVINSYEGMNVVGEVYGEWTSTVAQSEVAAILPSLSNVDMVIGQGGDAYGAAMAFTAAGMDVPLITAGNRGDFLNWWMDEYKMNGYETISGMASPWFAAASLYMMIDILDGVEVPQYMYYPMETITVDNLFDYEGIADTAVAAEEHDWDWVRETLETQDSAANKPEMVTD